MVQTVSIIYVPHIHAKYYKVRCDFKSILTPLCHPYQIAETSILDSRKEIFTKMQLPRAIITSKLEKCLKITHLPTSSKKSDKKGKIAIRIFFSFPTKFPIATLFIIWKLHLAVYSFSRIPVEQIQTHWDVFIFIIVTRPSRQAIASFWLFARKSVSKFCTYKRVP
jgi:hypothetical protein